MTSSTSTTKAAWTKAAHATIDSERDRLIDFLSAYVAIPSVNPHRAVDGETGDESACQVWLAEQLRASGRFETVDVWEEAPRRPNVAARLRGRTGTAGVMFNGHTDTVEVTPDQRAAWTGDPFSGEVRDGLLHGRGATDMKAGVAAFAWAAKVIGQLAVPLTADVIVTATIGEETAEAEIGPLSVLERGYTAPFVVNAEPTSLRICPAGMGWFFVRITVEGRRLHPASRFTAVYPQPFGASIEGVDAIDKLRLLMNALSVLDRSWGVAERHPLMPPGAMGLCPVWIGGGDHKAAMSDSASVEYAVPFRPGLRSEDVLAQIGDVVTGAAAADPWLRAHPPVIEAPVIHRVLEPLDLDPDHPGIHALARSFRQALGREPELGCLPGPCDANLMAEAGQSVAIFGPGDLARGAHGTDEHVPVDEVIAACKVFAGLMIDQCAAAT